MKTLKAFIKPFEVQKEFKNKILIVISIQLPEMHGTGRVKVNSSNTTCPLFMPSINKQSQYDW